MLNKKILILTIGSLFLATSCQNGDNGDKGMRPSSDHPTPPSGDVVVTGEFDQNYDFTFKNGDPAKSVTLIFKTTTPAAHAGPLTIKLDQIPANSALQVSANGSNSCSSVDSSEKSCKIQLNLMPTAITSEPVTLQLPIEVQGAKLYKPVIMKYMINDSAASDFSYDFPTEQKISSAGTFGTIPFEFFFSGPKAQQYTLDNINDLNNKFKNLSIDNQGKISWLFLNGPTDSADFIVTAHYANNAKTTKTYHLNFTTDGNKIVSYDSSFHAIDIGETPSDNKNKFTVAQDIYMPGTSAFFISDADNKFLKTVGMTFYPNTGIFNGTPKQYFEHTFTITRNVYDGEGKVVSSSIDYPVQLTLVATHNTIHWIGATNSLKFGDPVNVKAEVGQPDASGLTLPGISFNSCNVISGSRQLPNGLYFEYQNYNQVTKGYDDVSISGTIQERNGSGNMIKIPATVQCTFSNGLLTAETPIVFTINPPAP